VEKPMVLEINNKGAKDLVNNWSVGGRLRHVEVKHFFLRELKEQELIVVKWMASEDNTSRYDEEELGRTRLHPSYLDCVRQRRILCLQLRTLNREGVTQCFIILMIEGPSVTGVTGRPIKGVPHDQKKTRIRRRTDEEQREQRLLEPGAVLECIRYIAHNYAISLASRALKHFSSRVFVDRTCVTTARLPDCHTIIM
jgi:hypothetical protein